MSNYDNLRQLGVARGSYLYCIGGEARIADKFEKVELTSGGGGHVTLAELH